MANGQFIASVHRDYIAFIPLATDEELGQFIRAQICLSSGEEVPVLGGAAKALFDTHVALIARLEEASRVKSEAGKQGGNPALKQKRAKVKRSLSSGKAEKKQSLSDDKSEDKPVSVSVSDSVSVSVSEEGTCVADAPPRTQKSKRFVPPSPEEVAIYCIERGNGIDGQYFVDYYAVRGWRLKQGPMRDWKAAVRTWERNNFANQPRGQPTLGNQTSQTDRVLQMIQREEAKIHG